MNGPESTGIGLTPFNSVRGIRQHAGVRYLEPVIARRNLTLVERTLVHRVLFDDQKAIGIEAERDGVLSTIGGDEVILCAGGINSPKLLMLSGVGPPDILRSLGITLVHPSPGVGKNLMDHPLGKVTYTTKRYTPQAGLPLTEVTLNTNLDGTPAGNVSFRPALYTYMNMLFGLLRGQRLADRVRAGGFVLRPLKTASALWGTSLSALRHDVAHRGDLSIGVSLGTEESVGELRIVSRDPTVSPRIDLQYMSRGDDLRRMRESVRLAVDILEGPAFRKLRPVRSAPTDAHLRSDSALNSYVLDNIGTTYHSACTCRMGAESDGTAVVDQHCRVYGVEGLRVVDLSVLPSIVSRAPNATAIMLGERVSEFMRG
jgi:choline dehydrogenase-like flavoprotein